MVEWGWRPRGRRRPGRLGHLTRRVTDDHATAMKRPTRPGRSAILVLALTAIGLAGLVLFHQLRPLAYPDYQVQVEITPDQAASRSTEFARDTLGIDVGDAVRATTWQYDGDLLRYLRQEYGVEQTVALAEVTPLWSFRTDFILPLTSEHLIVTVDPGGRVVGYQHLPASATPTASLFRQDALRLTEAARDALAPTASTWQLIEAASTEGATGRVWRFEWERTDRRWPATGPHASTPGSLRITATVNGDRVTMLYPYVSVPAEWITNDERIQAANDRSVVWGERLRAWVLAGLALAFCLWRCARRDAQWRAPLALAAIACIVSVIAMANHIVTILAVRLLPYYPAANGWALLTKLGELCLYWAWPILIFGIAGEALYRARFPHHLTVGASLSWHGVMTRPGATALGVGMLVGVLDGVYQNLFYIVGGRVGFAPTAATGHADAFNQVVPWLLTVHEAGPAVVMEEFAYRLFTIPLLSLLLVRVIRRERPSLWIAIVVTAAAWGFTHRANAYGPFFDRALEVGLGGLVAGWLLVRFGILAPIASHFTFNVLAVAYGLAGVASPSAFAPAYAVAAIPLGLAAFALVRAQIYGGFRTETGLLNADLTQSLTRTSPSIFVRLPCSVRFRMLRRLARGRRSIRALAATP